MLLPAVTGFGLAALVTLKSACVPDATAMFTVAELSAGFESCVADSSRVSVRNNCSRRCSSGHGINRCDRSRRSRRNARIRATHRPRIRTSPRSPARGHNSHREKRCVRRIRFRECRRATVARPVVVHRLYVCDLLPSRHRTRTSAVGHGQIAHGAHVGRDRRGGCGQPRSSPSPAKSL